MTQQNKIDKMQLELSLFGTLLASTGILVALEIYIFGNSEYTKLINSTSLFWVIPIFIALNVIYFVIQSARIGRIFKYISIESSSPTTSPEIPTTNEGSPHNTDEEYFHNRKIMWIFAVLGVAMMILGLVSMGISTTFGISFYSVGIAIMLFSISQIASLRTNKNLNEKLDKIEKAIIDLKQPDKP